MDNLQKWFPFNHRKIRQEIENHGSFDPSEERIQVFCFPSAGSGASLYRAWCDDSKTTNDIEFIPVEIPGRGNHINSPAASSIDELVEGIISILQQVARRPFILYGHSFGAMVAFQLAHTLQQRGLIQPEKLIVAGRHAPHMKSPSPLHSVSTDSEIISELKKMGGTPQAILNHPEMLQFTLSQLRADLRTHESYKYTGQILQIPIEAHCGTQDDANKEIVKYWMDVTAEEFHLQEFPGNHFFIQSLGDSYLNTLTYTISKTKKSIS